MTTTTRMNDNEYAQALSELGKATELSAAVLAKLTMVKAECDVRGLEQAMGHRSRRGKSSDQGRKFINLVNSLNERFNCRLSLQRSGYVVRPAGSWR
jgi:hypothetical protein